MFSRIRMIFTTIQMSITVTVVIILMYMFKNNIRTIRRIWAKLQLKLLGVTLEIEGEVDTKANMIVINHQSLVDIILMEYLHPNDICWVAKKEIAQIPWFGHILKAPKMITIERESKSSLVKLLKESKIKAQENRPIAIFPEGTRTDGKKLRKFKAGAKLIAQKYNFKVQPIVVVGTRDILDGTKFTQKSGIVKVIYLPTIEASKNSTWYEDMATKMGEVLEQNLKVTNEL